MPLNEPRNGVASFYRINPDRPRLRTKGGRRHKKAELHVSVSATIGRGKVSTVAMVMPFQPTMWNEKKMSEIFHATLNRLDAKTEGRYAEPAKCEIKRKVKEFFQGLNFNTHAKSVGFILSPVEEKIFYFDYAAKPEVFISKSITALDLAEHIVEEPGFFFLVLDHDEAVIYEVCEAGMLKVYAATDQDESKLFGLVIKVLKRLKSGRGKPVFVCGRSVSVKTFCKSELPNVLYCPLLFNSDPSNNAKIQYAAKDILMNWEYWRSGVLRNSLLSAQRTNQLVTTLYPVLEAMHRGADGTLILDKKYKKEIQNADNDPGMNGAGGTAAYFERFLARGNRVLVTGTGFLKAQGGIALLKEYKAGHISHTPFNRISGAGGRIL